ncbi:MULTISPECIES: hypothetical protein [Pseudoalteromonas]|uniref:Beta/gamma crystallin 'Greek key' domain-containing protein n=1 Tax=Pseudoalteromonas obscura TaxID=3048491 RepID=A0ABT7ENI2_9GAMM|nr:MULTISPECIES: hypothetical protein [Pseudoalteromonas]MBQ4835170.1 hypothetical protein [Pseudoalteromonas luteoviolacea]MDK2596568.1 hypothetical protein [Pseudoalteromonas sp. P94(2023)]
MKKLLLTAFAFASLSSQAAQLEFVSELSVQETQSIRENLSSEQLYAFDNAINNQAGMAILYKDRDYGNEYRIVIGNVSNFRDIGFNDTVSSIKVINSTGVILYRDRDFGGDYRIVLGQENNLVNIGFNDAASSLKFF